jgi:hypothetical protein
VCTSSAPLYLLRLIALVAVLSGLGTCSQSVPAQTRPAPGLLESAAAPATRFAVFEDTAFTRAVRRGTRTRRGQPGPRYWQQHAEYDLEARLHPTDHRLDGTAQITYFNRSPDTLRRVALHLRHNLFRGDAAQQADVPPPGA